MKLTEFFGWICKGAASISPWPESPTNFYSSEEDGFEQDAKALRSDWEKVGSDINEVIKKK